MKLIKDSSDIVILKLVYKNNLFFKVQKGLYFFIYYVSYCKDIVFQHNLIYVEDKNKLKSFLNLKKIYNLLYGFYLDVSLVGIGFFSYLIHNYFIFDLGYSHFVGIKIPKGIFVKNFKNRFVIFGFNQELVMSFYNVIKLFKKFNVYKGKGFSLRHEKLKLKEVIK